MISNCNEKKNCHRFDKIIFRSRKNCHFICVRAANFFFYIRCHFELIVFEDCAYLYSVMCAIFFYSYSVLKIENIHFSIVEFKFYYQFYDPLITISIHTYFIMKWRTSFSPSIILMITCNIERFRVGFCAHSNMTFIFLVFVLRAFT